MKCLAAVTAAPRGAGRLAIARGSILGAALAASLPILAPAASQAAPTVATSARVSAPAQENVLASGRPASQTSASAIARDYVVRFYSRWPTFEQARIRNRVIAPRRVGPAYHAVVAVNDDTLYASAFIDVAAEPTVLTIPKTTVLPKSLFFVPFKGIADRETTKAPILLLRQLQTAVHDPSTPPRSPPDAQLSQSFDALFGNRGALSPAAWAQFARRVSTAHDVPLVGHRDAGYVLTFHKRRVPDAKRFWSLTTYLPGSIELVPSSTRKYVVASYTPGLETSRDGSISIYMAPRLPVGVPRANWLPVPRGRFNVMLRVYGPDGRVAENTSVPPPIEPSATHFANATEPPQGDRCPRSRDLQVGPTQSAFFSTVAPFEHFASDRTQVFPYTCTLREPTGPGRVTIQARKARGSFATPYIPVTRDRNQLFVYGYGKNPQTDGAFVASVDPVTLAQHWRIHIKVPPPGQWSYPGVLLAHGNGFLYAVYGNVLVKLDAASGRTLARRVLPEDQEGSGAAYNGMIILPDGRIVAKGIERGPCKRSGTFPGLICAARNQLPTPVVVVDPNHLKILSQFEPDAPVTGRITAGRIGRTDYVYLPEHSVVVRYRYRHRNGTLQLDNHWGPVAYRTGKQTSGTGPGLLRDWLVIQTNFLPSAAPMTVTAVNVHNAGRKFQIRPFVAATRRSRSSLSISKAALDPATDSIYTADFAAGQLVGLHLDPRRGLSVRWRDNIRSLDFVALIGPPAHRELVFTDYKRGADRVVWIDATTGHLLARSGKLAHRPAPGNIVTPGFAGRFYYLGSAGQLWELRPAHATP